MRLYDSPIAHRGIHDDVTLSENSMASYKKAIDLGYNIEIDVRLLKDGEVVVFHDMSLKRLLKLNKRISSLTSKELENPKYFLPNGEKIPLLKDFLALVDGKVDVLCELKSTSFYKFKLEKAVYALIKDKPWVAVQAFNPKCIEWFNKNANEVYRGQLASKSKGGLKFVYKFFGPYKVLEKGKPHFIAYNVNYLPSLRISNAAKDYNMHLICWTVKTKKAIQTAIDCKVDNIIFELIDPTPYLEARKNF